VKVKVKNIKIFFDDKKTSHQEHYDWKKLESDLKNGYDSKQPMEVLRLFNNNYILVEGHHRLTLIKKLYGGEYEVEVKKTYMLKILLAYTIFLVAASFWYMYTLIKSIFKKNG
jgi:hypothetical protein